MEPIKRTRQVFNDLELETKFQQKGYVRVPFLSEQEADAAIRFYEKEQNDLGVGYHSTLFSHLTGYRSRVDTFLKNLTAAGCKKYLKAHKQVVGTYLIKEPGEKSMVSLHADWCLTDESQYQSIIVWLCLMDYVGPDNGAMYMLPRSHKYTDRMRGQGLPFEYKDFNMQIFKAGQELVEARKGEAVIFDLSVLHYSNPNFSATPRLAFNLGVIPEEAPVLHYCNYKPMPADEVEVYEVGNEFYSNYIVGEKPPYAKKIATMRYRLQGATRIELEEMYLRKSVEKNEPVSQ
ncbi:MAG TPA: phytanoyl-CoA dioxygenase family protein [Chitinophagales bacterium]|nr:phytanoyl-CoA dioxygenase family protein [Chitinophagales bacterium]